MNNLWDIDIIEWLELIEFERKIEEESINIEGGITTEGKNRQTVNVVERPGSCCSMLIKKHLKKKSFSNRQLMQLRSQFKNSFPVKT